MRGSSAREPRLDPVRWRRPGRSALVRWAVVAALVTMAALVMWSRPRDCEPSCPAGSSPSSPIGPSGDPPAGSNPPAAGSPRGGTSAAGSRDSSGTSAGIPPAGNDSARTSPDGAELPGRAVVPPGSVGVAIRPAEPTTLRLLHPGDRVDVFSIPDPGQSPQAIATAALVLDVTGADDPTVGGLLLALTPAEAQRTVTTPPGGYAVLLRPG
jgi:hypothetical protein